MADSWTEPTAEYPYPPFSGVASSDDPWTGPACPKCRSREIDALHCEYHEAIYWNEVTVLPTGEPTDIPREFMRRTCRVCDYHWPEMCADAGGDPDEHRDEAVHCEEPQG